MGEAVKRLLILLMLGAGIAVAGPGPAAAQCHQECITLYNATGQVVGHGCVWNMDLFATCIATASTCHSNACRNALVTDANGAGLAEADICSDKVTLRPVRRTGDPGTVVAEAVQLPTLPRARTRVAAGAIE